MFLQGLLLHLRRDADVALGGGDGTMLEELLHQGNVVAVVLVYLRGDAPVQMSV